MVSSGLLRRVALVRTDVSKERIAPIIRVTGIGELGTTLAVTSNWSTFPSSSEVETFFWPPQSLNRVTGIGELGTTLAVASNWSTFPSSSEVETFFWLPQSLNNPHQKPKSKLSYGRWSVGQSVLVSGHHLGPETNFSLTSMEHIFRHLRFTSCAAPSLTRGPVSHLYVQMLPGLASAVTLRSKTYRARDRILFSHLSLGSLSVASYDSQGYGAGTLFCLHTEQLTSV
jgi:hypothetical protein